MAISCKDQLMLPTTKIDKKQTNEFSQLTHNTK